MLRRSVVVLYFMLKESFTYRPEGGVADTLSVHIEGPDGRRESEGTAWECRVEIPGHWGETVISGASSIQALALALGYVRACLRTLMDEGRLCYPGGTAVQLDELFGELGDAKATSDNRFSANVKNPANA